MNYKVLSVVAIVAVLLTVGIAMTRLSSSSFTAQDAVTTSDDIGVSGSTTTETAPAAEAVDVDVPAVTPFE